MKNAIAEHVKLVLSEMLDLSGFCCGECTAGNERTFSIGQSQSNLRRGRSGHYSVLLLSVTSYYNKTNKISVC